MSHAPLQRDDGTDNDGLWTNAQFTCRRRMHSMAAHCFASCHAHQTFRVVGVIRHTAGCVLFVLIVFVLVVVLVVVDAQVFAIAVCLVSSAGPGGKSGIFVARHRWICCVLIL